MSFLQQDFDLDNLFRTIVQVGVVVLFFLGPILKGILENVRKGQDGTASKRRSSANEVQAEDSSEVSWAELVRQARSEAGVSTEEAPATVVRTKRAPVKSNAGPVRRTVTGPRASSVAKPAKQSMQGRSRKAPEPMTSQFDSSAERERVGALADRHLDDFGGPTFTPSSERASITTSIAPSTESLSSLSLRQEDERVEKAPKVRPVLTGTRSWRQAILLREILDQPVSMRDPLRRFD